MRQANQHANQQANQLTTNTDKRRLAAILLFALAVRFLVVFVFFSDYVPNGDAVAWQESALNVLAHQGLNTKRFVANRTPVPALYFAAVYSIFGVSVRAVQLVNAVLGTLTVWFVFDFVRKDFGVGPARWGALFVSIYPMFLFYTGQMLSETPVVMLTALALKLTQACRDRAALWFIPVGIVLGLAVLTREPLLATAPVIAIWLVGGRTIGNWRRGLAQATVLLVFVGLTLVPWTVRNYLVTGKVIPISTRGGFNFWIANRPYSDQTPGVENEAPDLNGMTEADQDAALWKLAFRFISEHPLRYLDYSLKRLLRFWHIGYYHEGLSEFAFLAFYFPLLLTAIVGAWIAWRDNREATLLLLTVVVSLSCVHMLFVPEGRYRLPADLVLCGFAGCATHRLLGRFPKRLKV